MKRLFKIDAYCVLLFAASFTLAGCGVEQTGTVTKLPIPTTTPSTEATEGSEPVDDTTALVATEQVETNFDNAYFQAPIRIEAGGEIVKVESPGYACPTMADVDGDGKEDLVVGQFNNGHMQFCKNVAATNETPKFAKAEWLKSGDERAEVPGVW